MDVLADVIERLRLGTTAAARSACRAPWALSSHEPSGVEFHVVLDGRAVVAVEDGTVAELAPGDVVVLPRPVRHRIGDDLATPTRSLDALIDEVVAASPEAAESGPHHVLDVGAGPRVTSTLLCGTYAFEDGAHHPLLSSLPSVVHVTAAQARGSGVAATVDLLAQESCGGAPGRSVVVQRLLDVLFVQVLRTWLATDGASCDRAWLRGLADSEVAVALDALHGRPADAWTVAGLAEHVGLSRAAFARRFAERVGEPPMAYLASWRLVLASEALRDTDDTVDVIARRVGYSSGFALSRAFRRVRGEPPSSYRARHQQGGRLHAAA